jgi:hypothetical protein
MRKEKFRGNLQLIASCASGNKIVARAGRSNAEKD